MITISAENASEQIAELTKKYSTLSVIESDASRVRLRGEIAVYRTACGFTVDRSYNVEVIVPINSYELPFVVDLDGAIDDSFVHRYKNGQLCLETDTTVRWRFVDGFNLSEWVDEYVEPYFFSYEYYRRFGCFPFGERPHGLEGVLNTYQDILHEPDLKKVISLMAYCVDKRYRGHVSCPCGSGKKLRCCHGNVLFSIMSDPNKKEIVSLDVNFIRKAISNHESPRKNIQTSK